MDKLVGVKTEERKLYVLGWRRVLVKREKWKMRSKEAGQ